jgi:hypothetical protein
MSSLRTSLPQDVVWERLDAIDGNTVYVGSQIRTPGEALSVIPRRNDQTAQMQL